MAPITIGKPILQSTAGPQDRTLLQYPQEELPAHSRLHKPRHFI
jgi:hypothetical protein